MKNLNKVFNQICWLTESGVYSCNDMIEIFNKKLNYTDSLLEKTIQSFFRSFAEEQLACLQIKQLPFDYVIYPLVNPHTYANFLNRSVNNYRGVRPKVSQKVRFTVWDGNNAPEHLSDWTGEIIRKQHNGVFIEYIIRRDIDNETIKLARGYIREVVR
ncbi:hypothetical protein [Paenibacillus agricola]|uniref:Uncharacterized protein n=1 Tax=Paenibacillus agricola TaxID=2716264 RepID=A0ABX0JA86_9BACL|nr:hypothetical protein [Paenibacillus agricola]NHN33365.1 hypothetical protein [Paenibacillus agricola]